MDVQLTEDIEAFSLVVAPFLAAEPFSANVLAVELEGVVSGTRQLRPGSIWIAVMDGNDLIAAAMHTPPHNLWLPRMPDGAPEAIAESLAAAGRTVRGVTGPLEATESFARTWQRLTGCDSRQRHAMRLYRVGTLRPPAGVPGGPRLALEGEEGLVTRWLEEFHAEATADAPVENWSDIARRRIAGGLLWLWEDEGEVVSLAGVSVAAAGVARVGPVFTPRERRRRGYAAAVTAAATEAGLQDGADEVVLYTDLANAISNSVYQSIGYEALFDSEERDFITSGAEHATNADRRPRLA